MQQQGTLDQVEVLTTASAGRVATDHGGPGRIVSIASNSAKAARLTRQKQTGPFLL
jgi:hypothetical protein